MLSKTTRPALNTAQFFDKLSTTMTQKGKVDGKTMQEGLSQLDAKADLAPLKGLLAANGGGQLDAAAQAALMNFVQRLVPSTPRLVLPT